MPDNVIEIDPCDHITGDAVGQPGQRVFYLQGTQGDRTYTVLIEKVQLQSLAEGIEKYLAGLQDQYPKLEEADAHYDERRMRIQPPVDPMFRGGEVGLGYDETSDRVAIVVKELLPEDQDPDSAGTIRFWCTRTQLRHLARWGVEVVGRGRQTCPQCGQPIDGPGHFCPKKNGRLH